MRNLRNLVISILSISMCSLPLMACNQAGSPLEEDGEVAFATFNLEAEDGGFEADEAELAAFEAEDPEAFEEDGEPVDEPEIDAEIDAMPEVTRYEIRLLWGQRHLNPETPWSDWSGAVSTNVGALRVLRTIRFEEHDALLPRTSPQSVEFESRTNVHNDGLRLRLVVPRGAMLESLVDGEMPALSIQLGDKVDVTIPGPRLAHLIRAQKVDDLGNGFAIVAYRRSECARGGLTGHWKRMNKRGGVFGGKVVNADGEKIGRLAGIWGTRLNGKKRFYGAFIQDGKPAGKVRGTWKSLPNKEGGIFRGHFVTRDGEHRGVIRGFYKTADDAPGGRFMGMWLEKGCADADETEPRTEEPTTTDEPDLCSADGVCVAEPVIDCTGDDCSCGTDDVE